MSRISWRGRVGLAVAACAAGLLAVLLPDGSSAPNRAQPGRAERVVLRALKKEFPDSRNVRCRRTRSGKAAVCRWTGERNLSPNRVHRCQGRRRVALPSNARAIARRGRRRCRFAVTSVDPSFGFSDISIGLGRATPEQAARLAESMGAGLFRVPFPWRWAEPTRDHYELDLYDRTYDAMLASGIRPIFLLGAAPQWAWAPLTVPPGTRWLPPARQFDGEWREIAALLAERYPRAAAIEIWNEPNEIDFWASGPNSGRYADLVNQAYDAIKKVNPDMTVLAGVGNRENDRDGSVAALPFLRKVFDQGAVDSLDGLAVHPYVHRDEIGALQEQLDAARAVRADYDRPELPLWVTEFGFTTTGPDDQYLRVSESEQADLLTEAYRILRGEADVRSIIFQSLIDWYDDPANPSSGYGLVRGDFSPKPVYCALREAVEVPGRCRVPPLSRTSRRP